MSTEFIWQLPTGGDNRPGHAATSRRGERQRDAGSPYGAGLSDPRGEAFSYFDHLHQIARAAELVGFDGIRISHDLQGDESWIVAGVLARSTRHLRLLTEFDTGRGSAVYAAKNAASYQRYSGGRMDWQISVDTDARRRRQQADTIADADLLARVEEFLSVARGVLTEAPYSFKGRFFEVLEGGFKGPLAGQRVPSVYLSGESEAAYALSARQADVHVLAARPPEQLAPRIERLRELAAAQGRALRIGLRLDVLARETEGEARRDLQRHWTQLGRPQAQQPTPLSPQLWSEVAGQGAGLVGSDAQLIERIGAYAALGVDSFILGALAHFEEAYRFGEHLLPALRERLGGAAVHARLAA